MQLHFANEPVRGGEIERLPVALDVLSYNEHPGGGSGDIVDSNYSAYWRRE